MRYGRIYSEEQYKQYLETRETLRYVSFAGINGDVNSLNLRILEWQDNKDKPQYQKLIREELAAKKRAEETSKIRDRNSTALEYYYNKNGKASQMTPKKRGRPKKNK